MAKQIGIVQSMGRLQNISLSSIDGELEIISPNNSMRGENGNWILRATGSNTFDVIKIKGGIEVVVDQLNL